jgi:hypothetical protein
MPDSSVARPQCRLIGGKAHAFKGMPAPSPSPGARGRVRERSEQGSKGPTLPSPKTGRERQGLRKEKCLK